MDILCVLRALQTSGLETSTQFRYHERPELTLNPHRLCGARQTITDLDLNIQAHSAAILMTLL